MKKNTGSMVKTVGGPRPLKAPPEGEGYVAGVPLARVIPRVLEKGVEGVMLNSPRSLAAERFRRLSSFLDSGDQRQVVVVTSSIPSEGKTTISMNLALACVAQGSGETLVVDADLRRPSVHNWLKQPPGLGLSEVLSGKIDLEHAIHDLKNSKLKVLPAGSPCDDPIELLASDAATELMSALRQRFTRIIVDTPPVVPFADAGAVAKYADGILLVARSGHTSLAVYEQAISLLQPAPILGLVMNQYAQCLADGRSDDATYYRAYYHKDQRG
jgi:capsular exopolysaccharide synthesis family protein